MTSARFVALALLLCTIPAISVAQKPKSSSKSRYNYAKTTGKGTPAYMAHHKDDSAVILRQNNHSNASAELNRLEQQSMRATASSGAAKTRVRSAGLPKVAAKGDKSVPINFSGRNPTRTLTTTKSSGRNPGSTPAKPH